MKNKNIKYHKANVNLKYVIDLRSKGGKILRFKTYELANKHYKKYVEKIDQDKQLTESFDWSFDDLLYNEDHGFKQNEHTRIQNGEILESTYEKNIATLIETLDVKINGKRLGDMQVKDLSLKDIKLDLFPKLKADGVNGKERSHKTLINYKTCLNSLLNFALLNECRVDNPMIGFKLFKNKNVEHGKLLKPKCQRIAPEVIKKIINELPAFRPHGPSMQIIAIFALQTGARAAEQRQLTWSKISFEKKSVTINEALHKGSDQLRTKSKNSIRELPLSTELVNSLKELWLSQGRPGPDNYVFPKNEKGSIQLNIHEDMFSWYGFLQRACKRAGVDFITWHDLRHFFASKMLQTYPDNIWKVSQKMGHATVKITQDTYGHWIEDNLQKQKDQEDMEKVNWY
jgi:integrase